MTAEVTACWARISTKERTLRPGVPSTSNTSGMMGMLKRCASAVYLEIFSSSTMRMAWHGNFNRAELVEALEMRPKEHDVHQQIKPCLTYLPIEVYWV